MIILLIRLIKRKRKMTELNCSEDKVINPLCVKNSLFMKQMKQKFLLERILLSIFNTL